MKKVWGWVIGIVIVIILAAYIILNNTNSTAITTNNTGGTTDTSGQGTPSSSNSGSGTTTAGSETSTDGSAAGSTSSDTSASGAYKDGTYTGPVADAIYGQLQIQVTISGGKITEVSWPVYPNSPGHTSQVSAAALPTLKQEAIASQSANVNIVSGATQTSEAFQQSLATALTQAQG